MTKPKAATQLNLFKKAVRNQLSDLFAARSKAIKALEGWRNAAADCQETLSADDYAELITDITTELKKDCTPPAKQTSLKVS